MSKLTVSLSLLVLSAVPFALGCSSGNCKAIPDGVYTAVGPEGGLPPAFVVPAPGDAASATDASATDAAARDAATRDAAARDAARDADPSDAARRDAATAPDAARDAATAHDAAAPHDAASGHDAAAPDDAAAGHDAAPAVDAGTTMDAGMTTDAGTYTFHGGLPVPYDTWDCIKPTLTCEMTYICSKPGEQTVSIVTSYSTGTPAMLAFSITPPGTIVHLQPPPQ